MDKTIRGVCILCAYGFTLIAACGAYDLWTKYTINRYVASINYRIQVLAYQHAAEETTVPQRHPFLQPRDPQQALVVGQ
jgi:hypothetical protein